MLKDLSAKSRDPMFLPDYLHMSVQSMFMVYKVRARSVNWDLGIRVIEIMFRCI